MPIFTQKPNKAHQQAFQTALDLLVSLGRIPVGLAIESNPYQIYVAGFDGDQLQDISSLQPIAWRYFAADASSSVVVAGDVSVSTPSKVTNLSYGDLAKEELQATEALESDSDLASGLFRLHLLRVPSALAQALLIDGISADKPQLDLKAPGFAVPIGPQFGTPTKFDKVKKTISTYIAGLQPVGVQPLLAVGSPSQSSSRS